MTRGRTIVLAGLLVLAGCSAPDPSAADATAPSETPTTADRSGAEIDAAVAAMYQSYRTDSDHHDGKADWERPVFSADLTALIRQWEKGFSDDGVAEMQDFGWLCECQDWDPGKFAVTVAPHGAPAGNRIRVDLQVDLGFDAPHAMQLELVNESGRWLIDDIVYEEMPKSLRAGLKRAIAYGGQGSS